MEHFFLNLFQTHFLAFKHFGYSIIFFGSMVESLPVLGIIIPGQTILILGGFLVKLKIFGFFLLTSVAVIGAIIGDVIGFLLGKKYGHHFEIMEEMFFIKREHFLKTKNLIAHHPFKSIFFGRLHSLTRSLTPFVAGASNIGWQKFLFADIFSTLTWAFICVTVGFIFGKSFELAAVFIGQFILAATIIATLIILLAQYSKQEHRKVSATDVIIFGTCLTFLYLFAVTAQDIATGKLFHILDIRTQMLVAGIHTPFITTIMIFFTTLGDQTNMIIFGVILFLGLFFQKKWWDTLLVTTSLGLGGMFVNLLKATFEKARPVGGFIQTYGSSFPSGHAMMTMILATIISYTVLRKMQNIILRNTLATMLYILALCIGFSRVYLNVHWASDVLGGIFFGIFWATFMIAIFRFVEWTIKISKKKHELPNLI